MGLTWAEQATEIDAPAADCYAAITDFESYPEWQTAVERIEVLDRDAAGRGTVVEVHVDAKLRKVRYRLDYHHEPPARLWWEFIEGDGIEAIEGEFTFEDLGEGRTRATYRLGVDPGVPVPGLIARRLTAGVMRGSVSDLKHRVEGGGA
jgi:uncharacterized membrane protein